MLRYMLALMLSLVVGIAGGCSFLKGTAAPEKELVLYSQLEPRFTEALLTEYNTKQKKNNHFQPVKAVYEITGKEKPDLVLAQTLSLTGLKNEGRLQSTALDAANLVPFDFKDVESYWTGAFYDPVVFVINQAYARRVGQNNLQGWNDLENLTDVRYAMENLNNSPGAMNLLGAMAGHMGEQSAITYMWNTSRFVTHYTKFPFSSIRMVATGEADMTVTVQSMVSRYLESEFPAYVITPKEGTPATLYGIGVFKESENIHADLAFMNWLLTDDAPKVISQTMDTGYVFLLTGEDAANTADARYIWLNRDYLTMEKLEALTNQWVEKVRFSNP